MPLYGETWRPHPFEVGSAYRARRALDGPFQAGGVYRLTRIDHSHHDDCTVFTFMDASSNALVSWWWRDSEPDSACTDNFAALDG